MNYGDISPRGRFTAADRILSERTHSAKPISYTKVPDLELAEKLEDLAKTLLYGPRYELVAECVKRIRAKAAPREGFGGF